MPMPALHSMLPFDLVGWVDFEESYVYAPTREGSDFLADMAEDFKRGEALELGMAVGEFFDGMEHTTLRLGLYNPRTGIIEKYEPLRYN